MAITKNLSHIKDSLQTIFGKSRDDDFDVLAFEQLGYDGVNLQRQPAKNLAIKITESGSVTYIGLAKPGTAQATAKWQARKLDESSGLVITWADGDANFNNVATDLTALSYS